ncbi:hypothetical protein PEL8287_00501 [Roseovarius litorisediminis]|uniref:ATP-dependent transcriptional regulator n=1 Tax=Roseovarius litorisediminis TaxID=1312363 RepID=A0A1Y5RB11_9RHOB|nr:DUF2927 domain-containing protein [Roseovarius litorisediminis]SLN13223.1 hypothetical protein PEL8287_00501 [Roseovarius litorisediminis]
MRHILLTAGLLLALGACAPALQDDTPSRAATKHSTVLPPMKVFASPHPVPPDRSNRDIARDFLDLSFELESGRALETFSRFEEPISIRVTGSPPPTLILDLDRLIHRLRAEAGIDIGRVRGDTANITIEAVTREQIRRHLPKAACFVVPNISRLSQYRSNRHSRLTNWALLQKREKLAIFLPSDSSPQEVRDCLHEEIAQAIGPLNDLYRLRDSVFNDDNVHTVLTGFDMLILRTYYAPELHSGMSRMQVAARLPAILSRLNPRGNQIASHPARATPRAWISAIQTALGPGTGPRQRVSAAQESLRIAKAQGWTDHRRAFSHFALGRLTQTINADTSQNQFLAADEFYRRTPGTELHRAYSASHLAAYAISRGQGEQALHILQPHLATAERFENAGLLATLLMLRAEALDLTGRTDQARAVRLDSLGWARYGFGADWAVRAKLLEIAAISPTKGPKG